MAGVSRSGSRLATVEAFAAPAVAFATFGGLVGWRIGNGAAGIVGGLAVGVLFGLLVGVAMVVALRVAHPHLATEALLEAVGTGLLLILPFAALAATAEILFGWNASQAFSSAGLMTAAAAVGVEAGRRGGGGLRGMLFPAIGAFLLVTAWALTCALAAGVIGT